MAKAEIRPDGKKYRLVLTSQQEYRGGVTNTHMRKASYADCAARIKLWQEQGVCR